MGKCNPAMLALVHSLDISPKGYFISSRKKSRPHPRRIRHNNCHAFPAVPSQPSVEAEPSISADPNPVLQRYDAPYRPSVHKPAHLSEPSESDFAHAAAAVERWQNKHPQTSVEIERPQPQPLNLAEKTLDSSKFIPLWDFLGNMNVSKHSRGKAVSVIRCALEAGCESIRGEYALRDGGYVLNPSEKVRGMVQKLVYDNDIPIVNPLSSSPAPLPHVNGSGNGNTDANYVPLHVFLIHELRLSPQVVPQAKSMMLELIAQEHEGLKGEFRKGNNGTGYNINSSPKVKEFIEDKLKELNLHSVRSAVENPERYHHKFTMDDSSLVIPQQTEGVRIALDSSTRVSPDSCDFKVDELPFRLSAAAISDARNPRYFDMLRVRGPLLVPTLADYMQRAIRAKGAKNVGNHDLVTYSDKNSPLCVDFRMACGTATSITVRERYVSPARPAVHTFSHAL